jgi:cytochrome c oxidase subunit II
MQTIILIISLLGMAMVIAVFMRAVGQNATTAGAPDSSSDTEGKRSRFIWGLLIFGVIVTAGSLWRWPHDVEASSPNISVNVTGGQWYWEIDKELLPVGKPIVFNVTTKDVNHGMGVYSADGQLLFQMQGMPGYVNQVRYVFEKPGIYRILCMEFCGVSHHEMASEFKVVTAG